MYECESEVSRLKGGFRGCKSKREENRMELMLLCMCGYG